MPGVRRRVFLASVAAARPLDPDLPPLVAALRERDVEVATLDWDDPTADWAAGDLVLVRSTWDYQDRLPEFLAWLERVAGLTRVLNPLPLLRWNADKHYLRDLAARGIPIVPSHFVEPDMPADEFPDHAEFVVKPAVGAGSRDACRYLRAERPRARQHVARLLAEGRAALVQPYLEAVDTAGETALVFFDGEFSHAVRKGPLLARGASPTDALFAPEEISPRRPRAGELALAQRVLEVLPFERPLYARVDLLPAPDGPRLLELELVEPSVFLAEAPAAAARFAAAVARRLEAALSR